MCDVLKVKSPGAEWHSAGAEEEAGAAGRGEGGVGEEAGLGRLGTEAARGEEKQSVVTLRQSLRQLSEREREVRAGVLYCTDSILIIIKVL